MVVREGLEDHFVDRIDVLRIAGDGDPAERSDPLAEQRADIEIDEGAHAECVRDARRTRLGAKLVAVFEDDRAAVQKVEHGADMHGDRVAGERDQSYRDRSCASRAPLRAKARPGT